MARLLITGTSGFVGAATLKAAIEAGHHVIATLRPDSRADRIAPLSGRFTRVDADMRDTSAISKALEQHRPEIVIHLAWSGVSNNLRFDRIQLSENVLATCSLVEAASMSGCKMFIGMGSQGEYGPLNKVILETDLPEPTTLYGASKLATLYLSKQLAQQAGMQFVWLRLFSTYGPDDNDSWLIPTIIREMLAGRRPRTTLGTQFWDWLYVRDVADAILATIGSDAAGVFNLGSGQAVQVRHVIEKIRNLVNPELDLVFGEIPFRSDQVMHMEANIEKLKKMTGWEPKVSLDAGLAETVDWYRKRSA